MALFPIVSEAVRLSTAAPAVTDNFNNGVLLDAGATVCRASLTGGAQYNNGLLMTSAGQVVYVDATVSLPAGTQYTNGLPLSGGALCISTGPVATYSDGIPMAANGAVAAVITA